MYFVGLNNAANVARMYSRSLCYKIGRPVSVTCVVFTSNFRASREPDKTLKHCNYKQFSQHNKPTQYNMPATFTADSNIAMNIQSTPTTMTTQQPMRSKLHGFSKPTKTPQSSTQPRAERLGSSSTASSQGSTTGQKVLSTYRKVSEFVVGPTYKVYL